jgi:hypothetical protein
MRTGKLLLLLVLAMASVARCETIYAVAANSERFSDFTLLSFDSASPGVMQRFVPITGDLAGTDASVEVDPTDGTLYAFAFSECLVLCPDEPVRPLRLDPETGASSSVIWPGLPTMERSIASEKDIHPLTHELRFFSWTANYRYSLETLQLQVDDPLDNPGGSYPVAHTPDGLTGPGVDTFALGYPTTPGDGLYLLRIGGPGGVPSPNSGEVTIIGPADATGWVRGFDISSSGAAYFSTLDYLQGTGYVSRLYIVDLQSGATQELGEIAVPEPGMRVTGIAVASPASGSGVVEIPTLPPAGLLAFALFLAGIAVRKAAAQRSGGSKA